MDRAYSLFEIKSVDAHERVIEGIASTPTPDAIGDVMEPAGAQFTLPLPLLWKHDPNAPIGSVFAADVRPDGIHIKARLPKITTPGLVQMRVDEAWDSISANPPLVRGLSIGWKPIQSAKIAGTKFTRHLKWVFGELSAVVFPMNQEATILAIKAASGPDTTPGATGTSTDQRGEKAARAMPEQTTAEQISSFEHKHGVNLARMNALTLEAKGSTFDEAQTEEYTTLERENESIVDHLPRLRRLEQANLKAATPITPVTDAKAAGELRGGMPRVTIEPNLPKGTAFVRYAMCLAWAKGDSYRAIERAKMWADTPEVETMVRASLTWDTKAAVAAATTVDATWAGPLAVVQPMVNEFLELLRPVTLIDKVEGFRKVPFNTSVPAQTGGGTYSWVGQGLAKPVTSAAFSTVLVGFAKAAGIIVLTKELVKLSTPAAEGVIRTEMIAGIKQFLDGQLTDPAVAAVANVNPASLTNGAPTAAASGPTAANARADLMARIATFTAAELSLSESEIWLNESNAFALANSLNPLGQPLFQGFNGQTGGTLMGIRVRVTNVVGNKVILVHTPSILFADDGGVNIDASDQATIQMDSAPTNPTDASTVMVSLWQRNYIGLRAERFISWTKARAAAVTYISAAAYTGA